MAFMFENLEVYKKAMHFMVDIFKLNSSIKDRNIKDQLQRAALSIPLNVAEGQGRMHGREKRQFYNTARGSLMECIPLIQVCRSLNYISEEKYLSLYALADKTGKMLTGLIKSVNCD
ncbi:MAG: four helix bundle protein [Candidatus Margulisiibacteriota bacterium]